MGRFFVQRSPTECVFVCVCVCVCVSLSVINTTVILYTYSEYGDLGQKKET